MAYNFGQGAAGAGAGALSGGAAGGPWGALAGGLGGLLGGFAGTKKDKLKQLPTMNEGQLALLSQLQEMLSPGGQLGQGYGQSISQMTDLMDPSSEAQQRFADPYMREFQQQTVPGLAEQFAGAGGMGGGLSSSGFGQALGAAGGNLQSQLAQLKSGLGLQAGQQLMNQFGGMTGQTLGAKPFGYQFQQGGPDAFSNMFSQWSGAGFPGAGQAGSAMGDAYQNYMPIMGNV
ncbi:MAG: hypothetical protein KAS32_20545 [Candidatus Peribacteraceae bacterium]|nr:hypothetical protein [Candidatus Peribacteraceae bacterium]